MHQAFAPLADEITSNRCGGKRTGAGIAEHQHLCADLRRGSAEAKWPYGQGRHVEDGDVGVRIEGDDSPVMLCAVDVNRDGLAAGVGGLIPSATTIVEAAAIRSVPVA